MVELMIPVAFVIGVALGWMIGRASVVETEMVEEGHDQR